ncbi:MAG TPA: isochorismatase family cysteine hydrolase [Herpetosiphonaceae bacterium]|nr:isochorismatase family cysteine hydrolase [Herpetosiphonaceae bacterium]
MPQSRPKTPTAGATYLPKEEAGISFPPNRTVLLVIDPVNDFLSEGGAGWESAKNTVKMNDVVGHLKRAIEGARTYGIPVLFGPMAYTEEDYADEQLHRRSGINRLMFERKMFLAGSWGADFHPDLQPREEDTVLLPHKSCDVFQTDLPEHLRRMGTTHLVIAGMTANLCCESTGRHAMEEGFDVTFLSDAIGAASIPEYEASIRLNFPLIANAVITVDEFLAAVEASRAAHVDVQPGDVVRGSDHGEIGTVDKVAEATEETEGYLLVPRGLIFSTDTYIPLDAVVKRSGTDVFINIPKLIVGEMPWGEPPSRTDWRAKYGPRATEVDKLYGSRSPSIRERSARE